jgi:hypothetical protein
MAGGSSATRPCSPPQQSHTEPVTFWRDIQKPVARHLALDPDAPLDQPPDGLARAVVRAARRIISKRTRPVSFRTFVSLAFDDMCQYLPYSIPTWAAWQHPITWLKWAITRKRAQSHTQFAEWIICAVRDSGLADITVVNEHVLFAPKASAPGRQNGEHVS